MQKRCFPFFVVSFALASVFILFEHPAYAGGGGITGGATELTQIANNSELAAIYGQSVKQVANQIEQIQNQIKQYEEMLLQGLRLPDGVWVDAVNQLQELENLAKSTKGLYSGYGNMEKAVKNALDRSKKSTQTAIEAKEESVETAKANVEAAAKIMDNTIKEIKESVTTIEKLRQRSVSAEG